MSRVPLPLFITMRLEGRPNLKKILSNTGWLFLDKFIRMAIALVVGVWIARYLGPKQFGILSYAQAFVALFAAIATLGLDSIVVRDIVTNPNEANKTLGSAFCLKLFGGGVAMVLAVGVMWLMRPEDAVTIWLVAIIAAGTIFQAFDIIDFWFLAQVRSKYTVYAKNAAFLGVSLVKVFLIVTKAPLVSFAWAGLAEVVLGAAGLLIMYRIKGNRLGRWQATISRSKKLLADSWPLMIALLAYYLYSRIDQVMIGNILDNQSVGIYSASTRIYEIILSIVLVVSSSAFPYLVDLFNKDKDQFMERYIQITDIFTSISTLFFVGVVLFGKVIIGFLYGASYLDSYSVLLIQSLGLIFVFNAGLRSAYLNITSNQKILSITTALSAVLNIGLNYYLIPKFGVKGAAQATVITQAVSLLVSNGLFQQTRPIFIIQIKSLLFISTFKYVFQRGAK